MVILIAPVKNYQHALSGQTRARVRTSRFVWKSGRQQKRIEQTSPFNPRASSTMKPWRLIVSLAFLCAVGTRGAAAGQEPGAARRPNILFCFADDWGRYAERLRQDASRGRRRTTWSRRRTSTAWPRAGRPVPQRVRQRPVVHAVPQLAPLGPLFLPHRPRRDPEGAVWDASIPSWPLLLRDGRLPHRQVVQGLEPRHAGRCALRRRQVRLSRRPATGYNNFSENATKAGARTACPWTPPSSQAARRGPRQLRGLSGRPQGPAVLLTGSGRRSCTATGRRARARPCGTSTRRRSRASCRSSCPTCPRSARTSPITSARSRPGTRASACCCSASHEAGELDNTFVVISGDHGAPGLSGRQVQPVRLRRRRGARGRPARDHRGPRRSMTW